ncbi:MAG: Eco57I restriction-modification methylase domain-containing protein, partial [Gemmatimonadales bacterium]|nr:Eco57I restriction-modification methylase domain-containing protein [Gemmatimonadales bacterium]
GSQAARLVDDPSPSARALLQRVTILDPAVGSGAFLLGALELLAAPWRGHPGTLAVRKREIISHNLFGVDLNANAVRLAELRLWLEVIAADPGERPESVAPLPNLDALLRQGDSLADLPGVGGAGSSAPSAALGALRRELATATGGAKRTLIRSLRVAEHGAFVAALRHAEQGVGHRIAERIAAARSPTLFGQPGGLDREARRELAELRRMRARYRTLLRRARHDEALPWFHYQSHYADVFATRGGFDLVVGNPPWVRSERLDPARRAALAARYRWWRSSRGGGRGYGHPADLSVAFLERAMELAAPGGVVALLVPAKLATANYASHARGHLAARATLRAIADLSRSAGGAFDATVYPMALVIQKAPPPAGHQVRAGLGQGHRIPQSALDEGGAGAGACGTPPGCCGGPVSARDQDRLQPGLSRSPGRHRARAPALGGAGSRPLPLPGLGPPSPPLDPCRQWGPAPRAPPPRPGVDRPARAGTGGPARLHRWPTVDGLSHWAGDCHAPRRLGRPVPAARGGGAERPGTPGLPAPQQLLPPPHPVGRRGASDHGLAQLDLAPGGGTRRGGPRRQWIRPVQRPRGWRTPPSPHGPSRPRPRGAGPGRFRRPAEPGGPR